MVLRHSNGLLFFPQVCISWQLCRRWYRCTRRLRRERLALGQRRLLLECRRHRTVEQRGGHLLHLLYGYDSSGLLAWARSQWRGWRKYLALAERMRRTRRRSALIVLLGDGFATIWPWPTHSIRSDIAGMRRGISTPRSRLWRLHLMMAIG